VPPSGSACRWKSIGIAERRVDLDACTHGEAKRPLNPARFAAPRKPPPVYFLPFSKQTDLAFVAPVRDAAQFSIRLNAAALGQEQPSGVLLNNKKISPLFRARRRGTLRPRAQPAHRTVDRRPPARLLRARPVAEWFNRNAPKMKPQPRYPWRAALASIQSAKSGAVMPEALDAESAMALMLTEPLLIRRPLLNGNPGSESNSCQY